MCCSGGASLWNHHASAKEMWDSCRIPRELPTGFFSGQEAWLFPGGWSGEVKASWKNQPRKRRMSEFFFRKSEWWSDTLWNKAHQQSVHNAWRRVLPLPGSFVTRSGSTTASCKKQQKTQCAKFRQTRDFRRCQAPWFPKPTSSSSRVLGTYTRRLGSPLEPQIDVMV